MGRCNTGKGPFWLNCRHHFDKILTYDLIGSRQQGDYITPHSETPV